MVAFFLGISSRNLIGMKSLRPPWRSASKTLIVKLVRSWNDRSCGEQTVKIEFSWEWRMSAEDFQKWLIVSTQAYNDLSINYQMLRLKQCDQLCPIIGEPWLIIMYSYSWVHTSILGIWGIMGDEEVLL